MSEGGILRLTLPRFNLKPSLDDVAGRRKVSGRHTRNGTCSKKLDDAKFLGGTFAKEVALQMVIPGEVYGGEGNVTE